MSQKIYIIGHKYPDLDSVIASISYATLKNQLEKTKKYHPAITGEINKITKFVLKKYNFNKPKILENIKNKKIILVDHNEFSQSAKGVEKAKIIEILDHHKVNFQYSEPIKFTTLPLGSTNSIIYNLNKKHNIKINKNMAGIMLSAILDDTVITKSPTCTEIDKKIIKELSKLAKIDNWKKYGIEMFKIKSNVSDKTAQEIIKLDFKDFNFKAGKFGIGQIETVDLLELKKREEELLKKLTKLKNTENYHSVILFITDIIKEGSLFLIATNDQKKIEQALKAKLENNKVYINGIISRKKQVIPKFNNIFDK